MRLLKSIMPVVIPVLLLGYTPAKAGGIHTLADFDFMTGHWVSEKEPGLEESWLVPAQGIMSGIFRWPSAGASGRYVLELMTIVEKDEGIRFYFKHFDPDITPWEKDEANTYKLVAIKNNCARFELINGNPMVPAVFQYCRLDDTTLEFRATGQETPLAEADFVLVYTRHGAARAGSDANNADRGR